MTQSPLWLAAKAVAEFGLDELEHYCQQNPSTYDTCKWCETTIVSTPWFSSTKVFHMVSGGWIHVATELSPCGSKYPYRFAEPKVNNDSTS